MEVIWSFGDIKKTTVNNSSFYFLISFTMDMHEDRVSSSGFIDAQIITLSGVGPRISTKIPQPIELNHELYDYKIGLKKFQTYYAFSNITKGVNNCLSIRPGKEADFLPIALETGAYEISHINDEIIRQLKTTLPNMKEIEKCFILAPNISTFKSVITLSKDWAVSFDVEHSIAPLLGFEKILIDGQGSHSSKNTAQIQVFNSLLFLTDVTYPSIINDKYVPYIYHHSKHTPPGYNIVVSPTDITYKSLTTNILSRITIWVQDEKGRDVNFNHEELTVELKLIRKLRKKTGIKRKHFG